MNENTPRTDDELVWQYRHRFRDGPVGAWRTWHGYDMAYGWMFEFRDDGSGRVHSWDIDDDEPEEIRDFKWKRTSTRTIEVEPVDGEFHPEDRGSIHYDFQVVPDEYGNRLVWMYQVHTPLNEQEKGFWWSPRPVLLSDEGQ